MGQREAGGVGRHCLVSGRVQGVVFRASTRDEARRLGVSGTVRNLADGRVEVWAYGAPEPVAALCEWLRSGPSHARVDAVQCEPCEFQAHTGFRIG